MGDTISTVATKLITDGISMSYPCINPELSPADWFYVHLADFGSSDNIIKDLDLEMSTLIPKARLEDPSFDLVSWYRQYLLQHNRYQPQYYKTHLDLYYKKPVFTQNCQCSCAPHRFVECPDPRKGSVAEPEEDWDDLPDLASVSVDSDAREDEDEDMEDITDASEERLELPANLQTEESVVE